MIGWIAPDRFDPSNGQFKRFRMIVQYHNVTASLVLRQAGRNRLFGGAIMRVRSRVVSDI